MDKVVSKYLNVNDTTSRDLTLAAIAYIMIKIKNQKIVDFWEENTALNHKNFKLINMDKEWELFQHCVSMTVDGDIDEYINSLISNGTFIKRMSND